jgi:nucleoside-diphosphate-sugar epimerase
MKRILIIGKRGFIGNSLYKYLKKFYKVKQISFKELDKFKYEINYYNHIINTSTNKDYINNKYNEKFDNDLKISKLINNKKIIYSFISTRKIYPSKANLRETSKLLPKTNYSKNKLITEKKLIKKLKDNLVILRVSNIIGDRSLTKKIHRTFIDIFFENLKKGVIIDNGNTFKDFLSIDKFCQIFQNIIKNNLVGIYNISIGQKVYLKDLILWLNKYNKKKLKKIKRSEKKIESFYLNNQKLMSRIKIKNSLNDLKKYCYQLSKDKFS